MKRKFKNTMQAVFYLINRLDGTECELDDGTDTANSSTDSSNSTDQTNNNTGNASSLVPLHVYGQINGYTTDMIIMVDSLDIHDEDSFFSYLASKGKLVYCRKDSWPREFSKSRTENFTTDENAVLTSDVLTLVHMLDGGDSFDGANGLIFVQYVNSEGNDAIGENENSKSEERGAFIYNLRDSYEISENGDNYAEWVNQHVHNGENVFIRYESDPRMGTGHYDSSYSWRNGLEFHYDMDVAVYNGL